VGKKFEIQFDKHGNICADDPELALRIKWLLGHNGRLTVRLRRESTTASDNLAENTSAAKSASVRAGVLPRLLLCPVPLWECPAPANRYCPNYICPEKWLRIVQDEHFERGFERLGVPELPPGEEFGDLVDPDPRA
jgi:hypothetical protein